MIPETLDPCIVGYRAQPGYDIIGMVQHSGYVQTMRCHAYGSCKVPDACGIHNPSRHGLNGLPLYWRSDRRLMERICAHGIGHPDPDHIRFVMVTRGMDAARTEFVHGDAAGCVCCADAYWFLRGEDEVNDKFVTKDSGERKQFDSGMQRDTNRGKARFDLLRPVGVPYAKQFLTRCAELMARGAEKYDDRNWERAEGTEELARFMESANRHFEQWMAGESDEDHAAAVFFNILGAETVKYKMGYV